MLLVDLMQILDAIADQPEGPFNDEKFVNMANVSRIILCIKRLKKETNSVWPDAEGCETFAQRQARLFNKQDKKT